MLEDDGRYRGVVVQGVGDMIWCRGRDWGGGGMRVVGMDLFDGRSWCEFVMGMVWRWGGGLRMI